MAVYYSRGIFEKSLPSEFNPLMTHPGGTIFRVLDTKISQTTFITASNVNASYYDMCSGLITKLKLPDQKLLSSEEKESYRVYRIDISDTLMYIYNLLNQVHFTNI